MKHLVKTYEENYSMLERFITSTLLRFNNNPELTDNDLDNMFKLFPSLELVYKTDLNLIQTSPNLERNSIKKNEHIGIKREYLLYTKISIFALPHRWKFNALCNFHTFLFSIQKIKKRIISDSSC